MKKTATKEVYQPYYSINLSFKLWIDFLNLQMPLQL